MSKYRQDAYVIIFLLSLFLSWLITQNRPLFPVADLGIIAAWFGLTIVITFLLIIWFEIGVKGSKPNKK